MLTVHLIIGLAALIMTLVAAATGKIPIWVPVLLLAILVCIQSLPWK